MLCVWPSGKGSEPFLVGPVLQAVSPLSQAFVFYAPSLSPGQVHQSPSPLSGGAAALVGGCHRPVAGRELASFLSCELVFLTPQFPLAFGMGVSSGPMTEALTAVLLSSL